MADAPARPYTYSLPAAIGDWVVREAEARGESRSWVVKTALREFFERRGITDPPESSSPVRKAS